MRRGLTMVEVLVTLAILSGVMVAVATWTRAASSMTAAAHATARERAAVDAALLRIGEDVATGDFEEPGRDGRGPERVSLEGDALVIHTRGEDAHGLAGAVVNRYWRDSAAGELRRLTLGRDGSRSERILVDGVESVTWSIDERDEEGEDTRVLHVRIACAQGEIGERRFVLP